MKKKLNIDAITNELEGASLFFARHDAPAAAGTPTPPPSESKTKSEIQNFLETHIKTPEAEMVEPLP